MKRNVDKDFIKACILGLAIGDALGVPVEFQNRDRLKNNPVVDMRGFGIYPVPAGSWSDDTSMTLCALESLAKGKVNLEDVMLNFGRWYYKDEFTPTGFMFDVGNTCSLAIENYFERHMAIEKCGLSGEHHNGNGSLMRVIPFILFGLTKLETIEEVISLVESASSSTHAHPRSLMACGIYSMVLKELLEDHSKISIHRALLNAWKLYNENPERKHFERLLSTKFKKLREEEIKSTGYVVDTLEAAIWCLLTTKSYKDCVLKAVNLGEDTDTVAAVAGGLAGALYGLEGIPKTWLNVLKKKDEIEHLCTKAYECWNAE